MMLPLMMMLTQIKYVDRVVFVMFTCFSFHSILKFLQAGISLENIFSHNGHNLIIGLGNTLYFFLLKKRRNINQSSFIAGKKHLFEQNKNQDNVRQIKLVVFPNNCRGREKCKPVTYLTSFLFNSNSIFSIVWFCPHIERKMLWTDLVLNVISNFMFSALCLKKT